MSAALEKAVCQRLDRWLGAYVDGELDAVHCLEVEDHVESCELCCERVAMLHAAKVSVSQVAAERAPQSLRERVCRTLLTERTRVAEPTRLNEHGIDESVGEAAPNSQPQGPLPTGDLVAPLPLAPREGASQHLTRLRVIVPLAAAATVALVVGALSLAGLGPKASDGTIATQADANGSAEALAVTTIDSLVEDLVSEHAHPPQLDITDPKQPLEFRPILDVPVHGVAFEDDFGARYVGARRNPRAGMLQYVKRNKNRVTMYVFNPRRVAVHSDKLESRHVGARKVFVGKVRGYPVAASERNGVGYALTADDLTADEASNLVLAASR